MADLTKIAILLGYNGFGFNGLERSKGGRTIESDLLSALANVASRGNPDIRVAFVNISRGTSTEINEHAAFQVISMDIGTQFAQMLMDNVDSVNAQLTHGAIKVYSIIKMPSDFSARRNCDSRTFEFYIPTYVFSAPPKGTHYFSEPVAEPNPDELYAPEQEGENVISTLVRSLSRRTTRSKSQRAAAEPTEATGASPKSGIPVPEIIVPPAEQVSETKKPGTMTRLFRTLTRMGKKKEAAPAESKPLTRDQGSDFTLVDENKNVKQEKEQSEGLVATLARSLSRKSLSRSKSAPSRRVETVRPIYDEVVNAEMAQGPFFYDPLPLKAPGAEGMASLRAHRMSEHQLRTFKNIMDLFRGTHNFHNYIPSATSADDPKCYIRVLNSHCSELKIHHGMEWIHLTISAKAFAQSQISKMIALAIMVTRTNTPRSLVGNSFGLKNVDIPAFPSWGLICTDISFDSFARASGVFLSSDSIANQMEEFKQNRILEYIYQMERENMTLESWIRSLDSYSFLYSYYLNSRGVIGPRNNYIRPALENSANQISSERVSGPVKITSVPLKDPIAIGSPHF